MPVVVANTSKEMHATGKPRQQQSVLICCEQTISFCSGDRIQFAAPARELKVANRERGTVERVTDDGRIAVRLDGAAP